MLKVIIYFIPLLLTVAFAQGSDKALLGDLENTQAGFRIIGGQKAKLGQFPYQAAIFWIHGDIFQCGGSLISSKTVLTAAHCLAWPEVRIYLGSINLISAKENGQKFYVTKEDFVIHEHYDSLSHRNDIGLIHLPNDVQFNEYTRPIQLPKEKDVTKNFEGEEVITIGWGRIRGTGDPGLNSMDLLFAKLKVYNQNQCTESFRGVTPVFESNICAIGNHESVCKGDSGGPLIYGDGDDEIAIGIAIFVHENCPPGKPFIYTRVTSYLDWIKKHLI